MRKISPASATKICGGLSRQRTASKVHINKRPVILSKPTPAESKHLQLQWGASTQQCPPCPIHAMSFYRVGGNPQQPADGSHRASHPSRLSEADSSGVEPPAVAAGSFNAAMPTVPHPRDVFLSRGWETQIVWNWFSPGAPCFAQPRSPGHGHPFIYG